MEFTEFESSVMTDIIDWASCFYLVEAWFFSQNEIVEDYWNSYFSNSNMKTPETGLEVF